MSKLFFSKRTADIAMMERNQVVFLDIGVNEFHLFNAVGSETKRFVFNGKRPVFQNFGSADDAVFGDWLFDAKNPAIGNAAIFYKFGSARRPLAGAD